MYKLESESGGKHEAQLKYTSAMEKVIIIQRVSGSTALDP